MHLQPRLILTGLTLCIVAATMTAATATADEPQNPTIEADTLPSPSVPFSEVPSRRTETSNTYVNEDGLYRVDTFATAINYETSDGSWTPIDNSLVPSASDGYAVENDQNDIKVLIPDDAKSDPVKVRSEEGWIAFSSAGAEGSPTIAQDVAVIEDSKPSTTLHYQAVGRGLKESIVLAERPTSPPVFRFALTASPGTEAKKNQWGGIDFAAQDGATTFQIPAPFMFDDSGLPSGYSNAVSLDLHQDGPQEWTLMVTPDAQWLADPAREYPVTVDPTVTAGSPVKDCWISAQSPNQNNCALPYLRVGSTSSGQARRALVKFDIGGLVPTNVAVTEANLRLFLDSTQTTTLNSSQYVARRVTHGWTEAVTWLTHNGTNFWDSPGGDFAARDYEGTELNGSTTGYKSFDVTPMVTSWVADGEENSGLIVKQAGDESVNNVLYFQSAASASPDEMPMLSIFYEKPIVTSPYEDMSPAEVYSDEVDGYVRQLLNVASAEPNWGGSKFNGDAHTLELMGTGTPSAEVRSIMSAAPASLAVTWTSTRFAASDLDAATDSLISSAPDELVSVDFEDDYSGLVAGMTSPSPQLSAQVVPAGEVPVRETEVIPAESEVGRGDDIPPYFGGDRIVSNTAPGKVSCSTAFPVNHNGDREVMFAWHCMDGVVGQRWLNREEQARAQGTTTSHGPVHRDVATLDGVSYSPVVWVGRPHDSHARAIEGPSRILSEGDSVALNGGFSGTVTHNEVIELHHTYRWCMFKVLTGCQRWSPWFRGGVVLDNTRGLASAGAGDSGGGAIEFNRRGDVFAAGMISAMIPGVKGDEKRFMRPCSGIPERLCSKRQVIQPWSGIRQSSNLTLPTLN